MDIMKRFIEVRGSLAFNHVDIDLVKFEVL